MIQICRPENNGEESILFFHLVCSGSTQDRRSTSNLPLVCLAGPLFIVCFEHLEDYLLCRWGLGMAVDFVLPFLCLFSVFSCT